MASFNKFQQFVEDLAHGVHDLETDTFRVALTNTAPTTTQAVFTTTSFPIPAADNGYTATSRGAEASITSSGQSTGTYKLVLDDVSFTATGGQLGPFRYVVLYNDTPAAPEDPLIGWWDRGSSITLEAAETFTVDFSATDGVIQIA
jgi:hypothetical protein